MDDKTFKEIFPVAVPRKGQREAIEQIINSFESGKKVVCLSAPTGAGKSVIAMAVGKYYGRVKILTAQKVLQKQYTDSFKDIASVTGKANYICKRNSSLRVDSGICTFSKNAKHCKDCDYYTARDAAFQADEAVFNYDFFLDMTRTPLEEEISTDGVLVSDEGHALESRLIDFYSVKLDREEFKHWKFSLPKFPKSELSFNKKYEWLKEEILPRVLDYVNEAKSDLEDMENGDPEIVKVSRRWRFIDQHLCTLGKLSEALQQKDNKVICQQNDNFSIEFKPLFVGDVLNSLFQYGEKILVMSATLMGEEFRKTFKIPKEIFEFIEMPSTFPPENAPKYIMPVGSMSYKSKASTFPKLIEAVEMILEQHKKERGIIHTVNYEIAQKIADEIRCDRFIIPKGKNRDSQIEFFMKSRRDDLVLLSPSLTEGLSLDDDLAKFSVMCKVPYLSLGDAWVKERLNCSQTWYDARALITILQASGRAIRSETDSAVTYLLDSDFINFINKNKSLFPKWWIDGLQEL